MDHPVPSTGSPPPHPHHSTLFYPVILSSHIISYDCRSIFVSFEGAHAVPQIESACKNSLLGGDGWSFFLHTVHICNQQSMGKHVHTAQHKSPHACVALVSSINIQREGSCFQVSGSILMEQCVCACWRNIHDVCMVHPLLVVENVLLDA